MSAARRDRARVSLDLTTAQAYALLGAIYEQVKADLQAVEADHLLQRTNGLKPDKSRTEAMLQDVKVLGPVEAAIERQLRNQRR